MLDISAPVVPPAEERDKARPNAPRVAKSRRVLWIIPLTLLILATAGGVSWWSIGGPRPRAAAAQPPMKVPVMTATGRTVPIYRSFPGTTQALRTVPIQARVTGYLVEQGAIDGADVASGALLYHIDPKDYQVAVEQAKASLAQANASLDYSSISQRRNQVLVQRGWVSKDTYDQVDSTFHQGQATLANNEAALKEAELNLGRTEIRAPFAGRISASLVYTGNLISIAGTTLNTLVQLDPIYVSFNPAEVNLPAITQQRKRAPIETAVSQNGVKQAHAGTLTFIDNQVSQSTGTILVRATIANPDRGLLPGEYVIATLHLGDLENAVLVPQSAVGSTQIGRTLMIVGEGNKVEQRLVKLGDSDGDMIVVTDGLKPGDRVITGQLQKIKTGIVVQPETESH